MLHVATGPMMK